MKRFAILAVLFTIFAFPALAQTKASDSTPKTDADVCAAPAKCLSLEAQNAILKIRLRQSALQQQYASLAQQFKDLKTQYASLDAEEKKAETDAIKKMNLDPEKVRVNEQTFTVEPKEPVAAAKPPEKK